MDTRAALAISAALFFGVFAYDAICTRKERTQTAVSTDDKAQMQVQELTKQTHEPLSPPEPVKGDTPETPPPPPPVVQTPLSEPEPAPLKNDDWFRWDRQAEDVATPLQ